MKLFWGGAQATIGKLFCFYKEVLYHCLTCWETLLHLKKWSGSRVHHSWWRWERARKRPEGCTCWSFTWSVFCSRHFFSNFYLPIRLGNTLFALLFVNETGMEWNLTGAIFSFWCLFISCGGESRQGKRPQGCLIRDSRVDSNVRLWPCHRVSSSSERECRLHLQIDGSFPPRGFCCRTPPLRWLWSQSENWKASLHSDR